MIVILGCPAAHESDGVVEPAGLAGWIATSAAAAGASTQVVGRIGDDPLGDAVVLALARAGVGHAALLRDPARRTPSIAVGDDWPEDEAGMALGARLDVEGGPGAVADTPAGPSLDAEDVALGLRYLTSFSVLVLADSLSPAAAAAALDAAAFAGARTVAVTLDEGWAVAAEDAFVAPEGDRRAFATLVGRYAAALEGGTPPGAALEAATSAAGWTPSSGDAVERRDASG